MPSRASLRAAPLVAALLAAAGALAAASISFFVRDPATARYDLAAPVPADALYFKDYDSTPYTDSIYYQFDADSGPDFYCHFILADMGLIMKKGLLDYKLHYLDGTYPLIWFGVLEKSLIGLVAAPPLDLRFDGRVKLTLTTPAGTLTEEAPGHSLALVSP